MSEELYNVRNFKRGEHRNIIIEAKHLPTVVLTESEALDMIRCLSSALVDNFGSVYTVKRDKEGRGEE